MRDLNTAFLLSVVTVLAGVAGCAVPVGDPAIALETDLAAADLAAADCPTEAPRPYAHCVAGMGWGRDTFLGDAAAGTPGDPSLVTVFLGYPKFSPDFEISLYVTGAPTRDTAALRHAVETGDGLFEAALGFQDFVMVLGADAAAGPFEFVPADEANARCPGFAEANARE